MKFKERFNKLKKIRLNWGKISVVIASGLMTVSAIALASA
jgi:hypothetical protein